MVGVTLVFALLALVRHSFQMLVAAATFNGPTHASARRTLLANAASYMALQSPLVAFALVDCMADCEQNCKRNAPGSKEYCTDRCIDYCEQTDRRDGLSGSMNSDAAEFGWKSSFKLPNEPVKGVVFGQDTPPGLPDVFGVKDRLRKAVAGDDLTGGVEGQGGVRSRESATPDRSGNSKALTSLLLAFNARPTVNNLVSSFPGVRKHTALMRVGDGLAASTRASLITKGKKLSNARRTQLQAKEPELVRGIGAGRDLPAPSGINTLPLPSQAAVSIGILLAVALGTEILAGPVFEALRGSSLWSVSRPSWPALGLIYLAAGIAHFTELEGFENITPPNGTWGWFYTPFSPRVNVIWTGVVEIFGGSWLLFGALAPLLGFTLPASLGPVESDGALTLFLLTALVTPANIYALTHGANFPLDLETPPKAHAIRLAFQPVLLAMLLEMSQTTLLDAKANLGLF